MLLHEDFFVWQIHHIDFDDENNVINKNVFLHREGEVWHISASTFDSSLLATCYNKSRLACVHECVRIVGVSLFMCVCWQGDRGGGGGDWCWWRRLWGCMGICT